VIVDNFKPNMKLKFERFDLTDKTENFQFNVDYEGEFLLSNILPKRIKEVTISFSHNYCLHFVGLFTPIQVSKFTYYQKSGVYHIQNYGYRFENLEDLVKVIQHKGEAGFTRYENQYSNNTEENIYFLIFCPFANIGSMTPFSATINYKFELDLKGKKMI
jgi:hypothetical protein